MTENAGKATNETMQPSNTPAWQDLSGHIAFVGFGEAASAFVAGWRGFAAPAITAYDIKTDSDQERVRAAKRADYDRMAVDGRPDLASALASARLVFSTVTPDQALVAARNAAPHLTAGALYLDCNSCAPGTKRAAAGIVEAAGGRYVDIAVMAPVHPKLHATAMLASGPHASDALAVLAALDMTPKIVPGEVGSSTAIKMVRSVMMKGLEALVLECVLAGRRAGVADTVLDSLDATYPGFDWRKRSAYMLERVMTHGTRRSGEMLEAARTVDELGLGGAMSRATSAWEGRVGALGLNAAEIGEDDYAKLADAILDAMDMNAADTAETTQPAEPTAVTG